MRGEVWIATRDIQEPNLRVLKDCPLPDRFQHDHVVKNQLMPFFKEETFKKISPLTSAGGEDEATTERLARLQAVCDALIDRVERLEGKNGSMAGKSKAANREG